MGKIFEAALKGKSEVADLLLSSLAEADAAVAPKPSPSQAKAVQPENRGDIEPDFEKIRAIPWREGLLPLESDLPAAVMPMRLSGSAPLLPFDATHRQAAEQYRIVRTRILQHPKQPRVVVVSSPAAGDGKSVTAVNVAGAVALKGQGRVLLVDADFRRSGLGEKLGISASAGLSDVLAGHCSLQSALVRVEQFPNLYVLFAGRPAANPAELLDASRWLAACDEFRQHFSHVIIDSPPIGIVADYDLIQAGCDGVILVFRPDRTDRQAAFRALEAVPKEKCLGVVMNCVPRWFLSKSYYAPYDDQYY
jgi:capsular exopolysaccharide synthesis family protein